MVLMQYHFYHHLISFSKNTPLFWVIFLVDLGVLSNLSYLFLKVIIFCLYGGDFPKAELYK